MFTAVQYRAKAIEYAARIATARSPSETREFQNLERTYRSLADNAEWLASSFDAAMPVAPDESAGGSASAAEDQLLACLGSAVIMRWGSLPAKIQRELFECATSIADLQQTAQMKDQIARFLHLHKGDGPTSA